MGNGNKTFIRITNKDIYENINKLHDRMDSCEKGCEKLENNSKVNKLMIYGLYSSMAILIAVLVQHILR